jgi:hypothetical protein
MSGCIIYCPPNSGEQRSRRYIMKCLVLISLLLVFAFPGYSAVTVQLKPITESRDILYCNATVTSERGSVSRKAYILNGKAVKPQKFVWLFPGFKPEGDPYRQAPSYFINNWGLSEFCKKNNFVCIIPDMGASMYPLNEYKNSEKVSDMFFLKELYNEIIFNRHKDAPLVIIGVSTGVEGAVKFSTLVSNVESIIGISGTYDYYSIPKASGEYRIHEYALGKDSTLWRGENPVEILRKSVRLKLYLFCESNSIYFSQARMIANEKMSNIDIVNHLDIGKGYSHNWDFWGNDRIVRSLYLIMKGEN